MESYWGEVKDSLEKLQDQVKNKSGLDLTKSDR